MIEQKITKIPLEEWSVTSGCGLWLLSYAKDKSLEISVYEYDSFRREYDGIVNVEVAVDGENIYSSYPVIDERMFGKRNHCNSQLGEYFKKVIELNIDNRRHKANAKLDEILKEYD